MRNFTYLYREKIIKFGIISLCFVFIWSISNADTVSNAVNFSAIGIVNDISTTSLSLVDANSSDESGKTSYSFDFIKIDKIETSSYIPLLITDIKSGDKIIIQGIDEEGIISINRIISFAERDYSIPSLSTSTPITTFTDISSSTEEIINTILLVASTTEIIASSTLDISTTTTDEFLSTTTIE